MYSTPPKTRSSAKSDDMFTHFNEKFEEIKSSIISELKSEMAKEIEKLITSQQQLIATLHSKVTENESTIEVLKSSVTALKNENAALKAKSSLMDAQLNNFEQYTRRQTLRLEGIEIKSHKEEEPEEIVKSIHKMMVDVGINVPIHVIDRAHRIGPAYHRVSDNKKCKSIMVKFNNFRYRTDFYRKRKELDKNIKVRIDLTKTNYLFFKEAIQFIEKKKWENVYIFVDINCRIKIVDSVRAESSFVTCIDDVKNFLAI